MSLVAPVASSPSVRRVMQGNKGRDTKPEQAVRSYVHRRGLRFKKHVRLPGSRCSADLLFSRAQVAVFIDGCFWHGCPEHGRQPVSNATYWRDKIARNQERDRRVTRDLQLAGWRVIRAWEHEDPEHVADRVEAAIRGGVTEGLGARLPSDPG